LTGKGLKEILAQEDRKTPFDQINDQFQGPELPLPQANGEIPPWDSLTSEEKETILAEIEAQTVFQDDPNIQEKIAGVALIDQVLTHVGEREDAPKYGQCHSESKASSLLDKLFKNNPDRELGIENTLRDHLFYRWEYLRNVGSQVVEGFTYALRGKLEVQGVERIVWIILNPETPGVKNIGTVFLEHPEKSFIINRKPLAPQSHMEGRAYNGMYQRLYGADPEQCRGQELPERIPVMFEVPQEAEKTHKFRLPSTAELAVTGITLGLAALLAIRMKGSNPRSATN